MCWAVTYHLSLVIEFNQGTWATSLICAESSETRKLGRQTKLQALARENA